MKIIHISDLHFGMNNTEIIEPFFKEIDLLKPDIIIISGDLTQRARTVQFQQLVTFLQRFTVPLLIVPGNHDIPFYNPMARLIHPFKNYKNHVCSKLEADFSNDEVNILGVNSVNPYKIKDGRLKHKTLNRIENHFSSSSKQLNILFFHHNLKYFSGMHHPLENAEEFLSYLKESPIHIICTGHLHYANLKLIEKKQGKLCALLHAGSLLSWRTKDKKNSFYFINTNQLSCTVEWRVFFNKTFSSQEIHQLDFSAD